MDWKIFFTIFLGVPAALIAVFLIISIGVYLFGTPGGVIGAFFAVLGINAAVVGRIAAEYK